MWFVPISIELTSLDMIPSPICRGSPLSRLTPLPPPPPPVDGTGYVHSLPVVSQARQVVPMPLLTHLTLDRLQRAQAMEDRILGGWSARRGPASILAPSLEATASSLTAAF
jgi:hypothetical protein